jgi:FkbM family methyltransferase
LAIKDLPYTRDVIQNFDFYWEAVQSEAVNGFQEVDFSSIKDHSLTNWDYFKVLTPSMPESIKTIVQYIELTEMSAGNTVIDLGAHSGMSSMLFALRVGPEGKVIAVEADPTNCDCTKTNFSRFEKQFGWCPFIVQAAVWDSDGSLDFTAEANLGSGVTSLIGRGAISTHRVESIRLSTLAHRFSLEKVDIIKADIEGAEYQAFSDPDFFMKFHPTIIFEPANNYVSTTQLKSIVHI